MPACMCECVCVGVCLCVSVCARAILHARAHLERLTQQPQSQIVRKESPQRAQVLIDTCNVAERGQKHGQQPPINSNRTQNKAQHLS
jgi:hypothetical protein